MNKKELKNIVDKFLQEFAVKHSDVEVESILVFGSVLCEEYFYERSDIDLYIVIKNNGKRYRGIMIIDDREVEYFVNPIEQLNDDFENAIKIPASAQNRSVSGQAGMMSSSQMTILNMLVDGELLQDKDGQVAELQKKAQDIVNVDGEKMSNYQIHMAKYFINDYVNDLKDSYDNKEDFAWQRNVDLLLNYLVETVCAFHQMHITKEKYQKEELGKVDKEFVTLYEKIANTNFKKEKQESIQKLAQYVIEKLGGDLEKEWEIISDVEV